MYFYQEPLQEFSWSLRLTLEDLFHFVIIFLILPVFPYSLRLIYPCSSEQVGSFSTSSNFLVSLFMRLLISVYFEVLFKNSPCMLGKVLLIPKNYRMLRSVFCDAFRVLNFTWISSPKDESSISGRLSISISFGNSRLSLLAALKFF